MNDKEEVVIFRQKSSSTDGEKTSGSKDVCSRNPNPKYENGF